MRRLQKAGRLQCVQPRRCEPVSSRAQSAPCRAGRPAAMGWRQRALQAPSHARPGMSILWRQKSKKHAVVDDYRRWPKAGYCRDGEAWRGALPASTLLGHAPVYTERPCS